MGLTVPLVAAVPPTRNGEQSNTLALSQFSLRIISGAVGLEWLVGIIGTSIMVFVLSIH